MLFEPVDDQWIKARSLYKNWHRTDFLDQLRQEAVGQPQIGAAGDFLVGQNSSQKSIANWQLQQLIRKDQQAVAISTIPPLNGQVLIFDSTKNEYIPSNTPGGGSQSTLAGNGNFVNNTQQTFTFTSPQSLEIAVVGNSIGVNAANVAIQIPVPYAGTLKNMRLTASVVGAGSYTLQLIKNGVATTITDTQIAGGGTVTLNFADLTHTVTVAAGDTIFYQLTATVTTTLAIFGFSLEYDHA